MHLWATLVHHRERERERGREGERQRETERDRERQRETERHSETQRDTEREITNCKTLASVFASYSSIEEIHYCRKNIHFVTSPTVHCRYGESLCFIWASKLCQKRSSLCSANDVPVRKASVDSWAIWKWKAHSPKKPAILGRSLVPPRHWANSNEVSQVNARIN